MNSNIGELIIRGYNNNKVVNDYIFMDAYGNLYSKKSCIIKFIECVTDSIGYHRKVYPERSFFTGPGSLIPIDGETFRLVEQVEIYQSEEFSKTYKLFDNAVEIK